LRKTSVATISHHTPGLLDHPETQISVPGNVTFDHTAVKENQCHELAMLKVKPCDPA
jgi:hypothetical protein